MIQSLSIVSMFASTRFTRLYFPPSSSAKHGPLLLLSLHCYAMKRGLEPGISLAGLPFPLYPAVVVFLRHPSTSPQSFAFYNLPYSQHLMSLRQCNRAPCAHCLHVSGYPNLNSSLSDTSLHLHLSPDKFQPFCSQVRAKPPVLPDHAHQPQEHCSRWRALFFCSPSHSPNIKVTVCLPLPLSTNRCNELPARLTCRRSKRTWKTRNS